MTPNVSGLQGVNLGGWLCLEDWFYSGAAGQAVMSINKSGQGWSLPPHVNNLDRPWPSEGVLTQRLISTHGAQFAIDAFTAHRTSYISKDDLKQIASLGLRYVRVPMTWAAFADALWKIEPDVYGKHNAEDDAVVVPDPYYNTSVLFVTVPRKWLADFLRDLAAEGLKAVLDLHAFPAGAADGTYNGVWPNPPKFWTESIHGTKITDMGHVIAKALINWVESLDDAAFAGVGGLTLMNEPAHLSAGEGFATEAQVLDWLAVGAQSFRDSSLPKRGVRLYVNLIETAFADFYATVPKWFRSTFTVEERASWAVIDKHWYTAWAGGTCDGHSATGSLPQPGYTCDQPKDQIHKVLLGCIDKFTDEFAENFPDGLKATSEFSVSTYWDARFACSSNDTDLTSMFLNLQLQEFNRDSIGAFFWTWRMPYGPIFESAWSLKHIMGFEKQSASKLAAVDTRNNFLKRKEETTWIL